MKSEVGMRKSELGVESSGDESQRAWRIGQSAVEL